MIPNLDVKPGNIVKSPVADNINLNQAINTMASFNINESPNYPNLNELDNSYQHYKFPGMLQSTNVQGDLLNYY